MINYALHSVTDQSMVLTIEAG